MPQPERKTAALEDPAQALALVVGNRRRGGVEPLVHPAVVAREELAVIDVDHRHAVAAATGAADPTSRSASCSTSIAAATCARRATTPYA